MAKARAWSQATNPYDPSDVVVSLEYSVSSTGDRLFIPVNSIASMADQLTQCQVVSPNGTEVVGL